MQNGWLFDSLGCGQSAGPACNRPIPLIPNRYCHTQGQQQSCTPGLVGSSTIIEVFQPQFSPMAQNCYSTVVPDIPARIAWINVNTNALVSTFERDLSGQKFVWKATLPSDTEFTQPTTSIMHLHNNGALIVDAHAADNLQSQPSTHFESSGSGAFGRSVVIGQKTTYTDVSSELTVDTMPSSGLGLPTLSTTDRLAITHKCVGLCVYDTTINAIFVYGGSSIGWRQLSVVAPP